MMMMVVVITTNTLMMTMARLVKIVILMTKIKLSTEASKYKSDIGGDKENCANDFGL